MSNPEPLAALAADWPALSALMDEVLALPPAQRASWVEALDGDRAAHREALRAWLIAQHQVAEDDFLETLPRLNPPAASGLGSASAEPAEGVQVGPYRLLRELGGGGMGTVWLAERADGGLARQVALKLPRLSWGLATGERLQRERDILASLEHPHIARLYDAGTDALGRPYLAMEFIDGLTIDRHCREHELPLAERIGLMLQVAAAVAHAHARLVVHRDLKPANILVTRDGQVRLLDFGIAKLLAGELTADTALTQLVGHALTPEYASPEQIRAEPLSTASDIYSMGVVAYELFSGQKPYRLERASSAAMAQAIATSDPPLASLAAPTQPLSKQLRGDLDAILNKALKKDPAQRYPSADAFAEDLRRHLAREPVQAQPDRLGYRAGRFVSRYRLQVGAAAAVMLALMGGAGVALWQAHEARLQAARAGVEAQRANAEAQRANAEAKRAGAEAATALAVQGFIEAVFRANSGDQADPARARSTSARELLDRGAARVDTDLAKSPEAQLRMLAVLASMYEDLAMIDKALALQERRVALARTLHGERSEAVAEAMAGLGHAHTNLEQRDRAVATLDAAARMLEGIGRRESAAGYQIDIAYASLLRRYDPVRGVAAAARALKWARGRPADVDTVRALSMHGENAEYAGLHAEARTSLQEAIALVEARPELGASILAQMVSTLAEVHTSLGEHGVAEGLFRRSIALSVAQSGADGFMAQVTGFKLSDFLSRTGRHRESLDVARPLAAWARRADGQYASMGATLLAAFGRGLIVTGRIDEGLAVLDEVDRRHPDMRQVPDLAGPMLSFRAEALVAQGRLDEAGALLERASQLFDAAGGVQRGMLYAPQAAWLQARGEPARALQAYRDWRVRLKLAPEAAPSDSATLLSEAAQVTLATGDAARARELAEQALASAERNRPTKGERMDTRAKVLLTLGQAELALGRPAQALKALSDSLVLHRTVYDPAYSLRLADALQAHARAAQAQGQVAVAAQSRAEARAIHARHSRVGGQHRG
jgi:serine/threonine-protein kinase